MDKIVINGAREHNLKDLNLLNQSIDIFFTDQSLRNFLNQNSINFE